MSDRPDIICPRCFSPVELEDSGAARCHHCGTDFIVGPLEAGHFDESPLAVQADDDEDDDDDDDGGVQRLRAELAALRAAFAALRDRATEALLP